MSFFRELKKIKPVTAIFAVLLLLLCSAVIFFAGSLRSGAVSVYNSFTGMIYPQEKDTRTAQDDAFIAQYARTPRPQLKGIKAVTVSLPQYDVREPDEAADVPYQQYASEKIDEWVAYAAANGFNAVECAADLYTKSDFDVLSYTAERCDYYGLMLIARTDLLTLSERNREEYLDEKHSAVYETVPKTFWQKLFFPRREEEQKLVGGISPDWIYIDEEGARRISPSSPDARDYVTEQLKAFVDRYQPDMLLLDTPVYNSGTLTEPAELEKLPAGTAVNDMRRRSTQLLVMQTSQLVSESYPGMYFGVCADNVWRPLTSDEGGIDMGSSYGDYDKGFADTLLWAKNGYVDFIHIDTPYTESSKEFKTVLDWWCGVQSDTGISLMNSFYAKMMGSDESWNDYYELANQYNTAATTGLYNAVFDDVSALIANEDETALLLKVFADELIFETADEELSITSPKNNITLDIPVVAVSGTCDNNFPILINGREVKPTELGFFAYDIELKPGENTIKVEHKGKTITRRVTYNIIVIKDITPTGTVSVMGGNEVEYMVTARKGAKVLGILNGQSVGFTEKTAEEENASSESPFATFVGVFKTPESQKEAYSIGSAKVTASFGGFTKTLTGASVTIEPLPEIIGRVAVVTTELGETFRAEPANSDTSLPQYYWLPKGTADYVTGESTYSENGVTKKYYTLRCGLRIYQHESELIENGSVPVNKTSAVNMFTSDNYTYVTFKNTQKIPFLIQTQGLFAAGDTNATTASVGDFTRFDIVLCGTNGAAQVDGEGTALFSSASSQADEDAQTATYSFTLTKTGMFLGFTSYYDANGSLVFKFRNPINVSGGRLDGARICIDAGHGGVDSGAHGFLNEADENLKVALELKKQLEALGATVFLTRDNNKTYTDGQTITSAMLRDYRVALIGSFNIDLLISVHHNFYSASSANGSEALYFYGFNQGLAKTVAASMSEASGMRNRGGKYQNVFVYRCHEYMSILLECGFLSNADDSQWLATEGNTAVLAKSVIDGVIKYFS